jgi:hypothetical protein
MAGRIINRGVLRHWIVFVGSAIRLISSDKFRLKDQVYKMTNNSTKEKAEFIVMGYILQAVMNDLKNADIHFDLGDKSDAINDFFQIITVAKSDMGRVEKLLAKYN